jgi:hypothetical protein
MTDGKEVFYPNANGRITPDGIRNIYVKQRESLLLQVDAIEELEHNFQHYIGTVLLNDGRYVIHVFEEPQFDNVVRGLKVKNTDHKFTLRQAVSVD